MLSCACFDCLLHISLQHLLLNRRLSVVSITSTGFLPWPVTLQGVQSLLNSCGVVWSTKEGIQDVARLLWTHHSCG